jgi:hypothetical protein
MGKPVPLAQFLQLCGGGEYRPRVAARRLGGSAGEENRVRQRWRIPQSPRQSYGLSMATHGAGRIPEYPLCGCAKSERAYRRIMSEIDVAVMREAFLFIEGKARITMLYGLRSACRADARAVPLRAAHRLWQEGEVRPTSAPKPKAKRLRRRPDPCIRTLQHQGLDSYMSAIIYLARPESDVDHHLIFHTG